MRIAIVENTRITHHGLVGVALHEAAALVDQFRPWADQNLPEDPQAYDGLVVFGGEQSALDDDLHPYLPRLAAAMRRFAGAGRAVLGICLGAQVLARGFGAENRLGAAPEFGWCDVRLTEEGLADPVLAAAGPRFPVFQWHCDTFTLPPGAAHLARGEGAAVQAFRVGRAWGMQFHFEASRPVVADWARRFPDLIEAERPGFLAAHAGHPQGPAADAAGLALARAWVAQV